MKTLEAIKIQKLSGFLAESAINGVIMVISEVLNMVIIKIHLNPYLEDNHAPNI